MIQPGRCLLATTVLALVMALPVPAGGPGHHGASSFEPSASLDLGVRLVSLTGSGATRRALVEAVLLSRRDLTGLRLERGRGTDPARSLIEVPGDARHLRAWQARKVQLSLDLAAGRVHHLGFSAEGMDESGRVVRAAAYLRVNLDPALMPEIVDLGDEGLLQYRAAGGGQP